jgi:hypothetical protein
MWQTSRGERTLAGAEAELVAHAVDMMVDTLTNFIDDDGADDDWENIAGYCQSGISVYDELPPTRRVALLRQVAEYLLAPTQKMMPLSAYAEAAVAAIFVEVRDQVSIEIDLFPDGPEELSDDPEENVTWRELVLAAFLEVNSNPEWDEWEPEEDLPESSCLDIEEWGWVIDVLADAILWDRDFEMAGDFLDAEPELSRLRRRLLGINDDYFASIVPDPRGTEVYRLISETQSIVRAKPR